MPQTIDVTGLSPEAIQAVETLIDGFREKRTAEGELVQSQWPGPAPGETTEQCVKSWRAWVYGSMASARLEALVAQGRKRAPARQGVTPPEAPGDYRGQTIDVTGLSQNAAEAVQALVTSLREKAPDRSDLGLDQGSGPPAGKTAEEWIEAYRAWLATLPSVDVVIDDSRETIYAGRGE